MSAATARARLSRDELQQLRWLLGGLVIALGAGTVAYMELGSWALMAATLATAGAATAWPRLPARVPRWVHRAAFPVILAGFAGDLALHKEMLPAIVRLGLLLLLYRSICYRQRRDDLQVLMLGLFLIVVAGVLTVSLLFAVQILLYTAAALAFLLVITLTEGPEDQVPARLATAVPGWAGRADWPVLLRRLRRGADWRLLGFGAALFAGVVVLSGLLFLAIPRFQLQNSLFLDRFIAKKARSGFSETIRLGDVTEIQQDNGVALSVDVPPGASLPATPYWRMLVLDQYDGGTFRVSPVVRGELGPERVGWSAAGRPGPAGAGRTWTLYLEAGVSRFLPLLGSFREVQFQDTKTYRFSPDLLVLALRDEPASMTAYRVQDFELSPLLPDPAFARRLAARPAAGEAARGAPSRRGGLPAADQERLQRIVDGLTGGARLGAADFAARANDWLRRGHAYSLLPTIPEGAGDPLVRWLVSSEPGHCELFAGALVLLARTAGHPARVVTGFKGGTWNAFSNSYTVRNADAHAWVELFDPASGAWLRADPLGISAGAQADQEVRGEAALAARADRSWSARLDSLRIFWYRRIVSFDQQAQLETLQSVKRATEQSGQRLRLALEAAVAGVRDWLSTPWTGARLGGLLPFLLVAVVLGWLWRTGRSAGWSLGRWRARQGGDPVRGEASRWLARLDLLPVAEAAALRPPLERLRFGAPASWPEPGPVFRAAQAAWRRRGRPRPVTPNAGAAAPDSGSPDVRATP